MSSYHSAPSPGSWTSPDLQAGPSHSSRPSPLSNHASPLIDSGTLSYRRASPRKDVATPPDAMEQFYDADSDDGALNLGFGVLGLGPPPVQPQDYSPATYHNPSFPPLDDPPSKPSPSLSNHTRSSGKGHAFSPGYSPVIPQRSPSGSLANSLSTAQRSPYAPAEFNAYSSEMSPRAPDETPQRSHFTPYGSMSSPHRERLGSSTSVASMSSTLRGNRAPAPAALDLSPKRKEAAARTAGTAPREKYESIEGLMPPGDFGDFGAKRNVSDTAWNRSARDSRPLPHPPHSTSEMNLAGSLRYQPPPGLPPGAYPTRESLHSRWPSASPSSSINVPLSAVGGRPRVASAAERLSVLNDEPHASIDSYYLSPAPPSPERVSPVTTPSFSPISPEDPATIDRRKLVGVGELSTPRWGASPATHSRTPSIPNAFGPSLPVQSTPSTSVPTRGWARGQSGLGLGVGVGAMGDVKEETRDNRSRHHSVSHATPPRPTPPVSAPPQGSDLLAQIPDFDFDSNMTAALAASLGMTDDKITPPRAAREHRISAPPPQTTSAPPLPELRSQQIHQGPFAPPKVSPGSARSRIYARRASRQASNTEGGPAATAPTSPIYSKFATTSPRIDQSFRQSSVPPMGDLDLPSRAKDDSPKMSRFVEEPYVPPRQASRRTPPSSADSSGPLPPGSLRRKPGSNKSGDGTPKSRQSPNGSHHEFLKQFAPKDFSHLPPSPSSASINQFLRNSGSIHNFASPGGTTGQTSYFMPSSSSKTSLQRSDSGRVRASKSGWEGQEPGLDASEALRKLDGLSNTPNKSRTPKAKQSTGAQSASSRPGTPPPSKSRPPQTEKKLPSKPSSASLRAEAGDSPLQAWIDLAGDDIPDVPAIPAPASNRRRSLKGFLTGESTTTEVPALAPTEKRESTSSTSFVGTPTSRDSTSLPTSSTPPTSTSGIRFDKGGRRTSGGSEASAHSEVSADGADKVERSVPPVPPLPKSYMSLRQGISTAVQPTTYDSPQDKTQEATSQDVYSPKSTISAVPSESSASQPSHVSVTDEHGQPSTSYASQTGSTRRPRMSKKWSFSSALNLARHSKDSSAPLSSPSMWDISISEKVPDTRGSQTPWTEIEHGEVSPTNVPSTGSGGAETRSNLSITPVATNLPGPAPLPRSASKRLTPSSLPFFRRTSSSSIASKPSLPRPEDVPGPQRRPSGLSDRQVSNVMEPVDEPPREVPATPAQPKKSVLGMLRGSVSKRVVSNKETSIGENGEVKEPVKAASTGWAGRKRGKTLSISNDALTKSTSAAYPSQTVSHNLRPKASVESSLSSRGSAQSNYSETTLNGGTMKATQSTLPAIMGSPVLREPSSNASLKTSETARELPSITPTKIPRIANRPSGGSPSAAQSMPPPAMTSSKSAGQFGSFGKKMSSSTTAEPLRPSISEFGTLANQTPRQSSSGSHRAHLLAPMSARTEGKRPEKHQREPLVRLPSGQAVPPSRRHLPAPPGASTSTAPTQSSLAKRASRENVPSIRPVVTRRNSKGTSSGGQTPSDQASPIKPSKSVSTRLVVPNSTSKIPASSSMSGATAFRKTGPLLPSSPSMSPAEDEEALADAEMQAYVQRRKARKAAGKKEDLSDINEFPEDVEPSQAITQRAFVSKNLMNLSDPERREVLDFDNIYYSPPSRIARPTGPNGAIYNHGYDDERGDYVVVEGDHLCYRYQIASVLGKGSFGQVVQCRDHQTGCSVAVKIIRNKKRFHAQALVEVKILQQLIDWDPDNKHGVLRMTDHFYFRGHLCIVTELLSINMYELIKANQFAGFSTTLIRRFTTQMLASLQLMRSHRIVHCDLKPENILLCHPVKSGIKVIDFGSSCLETEKVYTYIQSRFYRSPEVILGMSYAMAIDMWSLGCILAELFTGVPIFPGENEHEQLACIMEVLGVPDRDIINRSSRRKLFFDASGAPRPFVNAKGKRRRPSTKTLAQALKCNDELFVDFIAKCLTWDPDRRLKPQPAMRHPWILAGRRRHAPTAPSGIRSVAKNIDGVANGTASGNGSSSSSAIGYAGSNGAGSSWSISGKEKKEKSGAGGMMISPPTPLMARTNGGSGASRLTASGSSSKLTSAHLRHESMNMILAKAGLN